MSHAKAVAALASAGRFRRDGDWCALPNNPNNYEPAGPSRQACKNDDELEEWEANWSGGQEILSMQIRDHRVWQMQWAGDGLQGSCRGP